MEWLQPLKKCEICGTLSDCRICFKCSKEKFKTAWRRKYQLRKQKIGEEKDDK